MQPYIFPYIGYFQLVHSVETFVFYDDVNFIKRGWINRNKILLGNKDFLITFPCIKASQNKLIKDVGVDLSSKEYKKILNQIELAYRKAPFFNDVFPMIESVFNSKCESISDLASLSVTTIASYLELSTRFLYSSKKFANSQGMEKADRLIQITKEMNFESYVNAAGGVEIYSKEYFNENGVELRFLGSNLEQYSQFNDTFVPNLSIIDVLMFNSKNATKDILSEYKLN